MRRRALLPTLCAMLLASCHTVQSATSGDGRDGQIFNILFWTFVVVTTLITLIVYLFLGVAAFRRRGLRQDGLPDDGSSAEAPLRTLLLGWTCAVAGILAVLALASWFADREMAQAAQPPGLEIEVTANQWWWDVRYISSDPSRIIRTANELHLPVGVPAHITLKSNDVIHSFWIPNLAGKQDLIPGRVNDISLVPVHQGVYRGQCAEFCGLQHAHMALDVTVESPAGFARWQAQQGQLAPAPATPLTQAGFAYVTTRECASCHNIAGTPASGQVAPDLTHFASRRSIAAGTFPMSRGHLYAWLADPQTAKPGNNMPTIGLEPEELHAVAAYLETLR